jgi:hypothetical protein
MPIGSSKLGVLGAGLVPGGSVTFNASGTWAVPPGVKKVSITGRGGTGNPGNAGNQGNPGNPGTGGGGGASGTGQVGCQSISSPGNGGAALKAPLLNGLQYACPQANTWVPSNGPSNLSNKYTRGGAGGGDRNQSSQPGDQGQSGTAGTAGTAGNPGNSGNGSNALGNTFPGGCGGNAGVAGAAGNGGTGGQGGSAGTPGQQGGALGSGGNGGGQGGSGGPISPSFGGTGGGGGAGSVNSGQNGNPTQTFPPVNATPTWPGWSKQMAVAGGTGNPQVGYLPVGGSVDTNSGPPGAGRADPLAQNTPTMQGGIGGGAFTSPPAQGVICFGTSQTLNSGRIAAWVLDTPCALTSAPSGPRWNQPCSNGRNSIANYNNPTLRPEVVRAGGGGGGSASPSPGQPSAQFGGGGGGGGRGNAGNAGGPTPTPTGSAGTPQTFNCVPVTPGTPTPITVGGPTGGQIVISWNPQ